MPLSPIAGRTDWRQLFHYQTAVWLVRLPAVSAQAAVAPEVGARLEAASDSAMISHHEQAARIGIGRSTCFEVKAGRGGKQARRRTATPGRFAWHRLAVDLLELRASVWLAYSHG